MKVIFRLLRKSLIFEYYRENVFFFLVVLLFAFGFLSGREHITLIKNALSSTKFLFFVFVLWFLYFLKILLFLHRKLAEPQYYFLYNIKYLSANKKVISFSFVILNLMFLTSSYALAMLIVGFLEGKLISVFWIIIFQISTLIIGIFYLFKRFSLNPELENSFANKKFISLKLSTPAHLFFHKYLVLKQPLLFLMTKIGSLLLISFFVWLYPTDEYDFRLFAIMGVFVGVLQYNLAQNWIQFQMQNMMFAKNLPISDVSRFMKIFFGSLVFLVPEIVFIFLKLFELIEWFQFIELTLFIVAIFTAIYYLFLKNPTNQDLALKTVFWAFVVTFILIMFKIPVICFCLFLLPFSYFCQKKYFRLLES